ncbi:FAD-binding oxidoreductase [Paenibacillus thalictri]|uniref:FAD-binding protein n=1 Tax=Paenibacillus thalictri TaxID=2527873 RepID=A0A4Q9DXH3_9BACL|nr:FAD-linked oxidase C-terminal domain-containing protein [Paenibacillus thalictri]TBL80477.1 FAD-binding protein [Paenibacillus thalictri]
MTTSHIQEMKTIVKTGRVLTDESDRYSYSFDASFGTYLPDVVIQTKNAEELATLVKMANRERIPVYPRGQATSLSGGPLPVHGGIVLDLSVMNDVLEIHDDDLVAVVSPGVLTSNIHKAAEQKGLMYPPDPSSSHVSTIGGNLAENSGGPRGLKYGVTKDYVIGLEVITPQGELIRTGGRTVKNVTGYDLTKLIVGSEGTLGIITKAILRLIPKPPAAETVMAVFDSLVDAGTAISKILTSGILPAKMELMDQASIVAVENYEPSGLPRDAAAMIMIELDGHPLAVKDEAEQVSRVCKEAGAREVRVPRTQAEKDEVWKARKLVSPAIVRIKPTKISEDATVPRSQIPEMCRRLQEIKAKYNLELVVFGHAGDGNLHPNILADKSDKEEMRRVEQAVAEIFETAVQLGGTLSGEHGIGTMKAPFMEMELGAEGLDMMKRIKDAWDPNHIMNPGKIFPEPGQKLVLSE